MASGNIGHVPASTFAEYVHEALLDLQRAQSMRASDLVSDSDSDSGSGSEVNALAEHHSQSLPEDDQSRRMPRPLLAYRINSHRLHVRAKAKLQRDRLLSGPMIDIFVGRSKRHWALHRNLLSHHSEYLASQLEPSHDGKRKLKDKLELPNHDPSGFELLVKWLYQGKLDDVSDMADPQQKYEYAVSCHRLYLLCDHFEMPQLKNVAMDQYRKGLNQAQLVPDAEEINDIYRQSPSSSPFRRLMTNIAARQIMDPDNERDVDTYRECFNDNPDFAIDLVKAIKTGTGGMLFEDPTEGNECQYHDHDAGPNCHIKGKGRSKQAPKASIRRQRVPKSSNSPPTSNSATASNGSTADSKVPQAQQDLTGTTTNTHPTPRPLPPTTPTRLAGHPDRPVGGNAGPLRRRLTSPASSTVSTSTEIAMGMAMSPAEQRDNFLLTGHPTQHPTQDERASPHQAIALNGLRLSFGNEYRQLRDKTPSDKGGMGSSPSSKASLDDSPPRRGLWEWARAGTGRIGKIVRRPQADPEAASAEGLHDNDIRPSIEGNDELQVIEESQDDFSVPSTMATEPLNEATANEAAAAKLEGFGIASSTMSTSSMFAETKQSSDDLFAASTVDSTYSTPSRFRHFSSKDTSPEQDNTDSNEDSSFYTPYPSKHMPNDSKSTLNGNSNLSTPVKATGNTNGHTKRGSSHSPRPRKLRTEGHPKEDDAQRSSSHSPGPRKLKTTGIPLQNKVATKGAFAT